MDLHVLPLPLDRFENRASLPPPPIHFVEKPLHFSSLASPLLSYLSLAAGSLVPLATSAARDDRLQWRREMGRLDLAPVRRGGSSRVFSGGARGFRQRRRHEVFSEL